MSQAQDPRSNPRRSLAPLAAFGLVAAAIGVGFFLGSGKSGPSGAGVDSAAPLANSAAAGESAPAQDSGSMPDSESHLLAPQDADGPESEPLQDAPAEPAISMATEDLYVPTGAATDAEGLLAAESGRIGKPTLVFFHADWCHVCQEIAPDVAALQSHYAEQVAFVKMNIDHAESSEATQRYRVAATPTFVLIGNSGEQLEYFRGWPGEGRLAQAFEAAAVRQ